MNGGTVPSGVSSRTSATSAAPSAGSRRRPAPRCSATGSAAGVSGRAPADRRRIAAPRHHGALRGQPRPGPELGAGRRARSARSPAWIGARGGRSSRRSSIHRPARGAVPLLARSSTTCRGSWTISSRSPFWTAGARTGWRRARWARGSSGTPRSTMRSRTSSSPGGRCRAPTSTRRARSTSRPPPTGGPRSGWSCGTRRPAGRVG